MSPPIYRESGKVVVAKLEDGTRVVAVIFDAGDQVLILVPAAAKHVSKMLGEAAHVAEMKEPGASLYASALGCEIVTVEELLEDRELVQ